MILVNTDYDPFMILTDITKRASPFFSFYLSFMIKVILADDHRILLDGFKAIMDKIPDIEVVGTAANGLEVMNLLESFQPDIVLLDINMPVLNGVETCKKITAKYPQIKVIALSMHKKGSFIKRMIQNGAKGYILKDDSSQEIVAGIRKVMQGERHFSSRVMDLVLNVQSARKDSKPNLLSGRELEVLQLISKGMTNQEIASKLFLSPHTTESHRRNMLDKLGAKNTADLVRLALEKGYI